MFATGIPPVAYPDPRMSDATLEREVDALLGRPADEGITLALVVQRAGDMLIERYGARPPNLFHPAEEPITATTPLGSWSTAKSMMHAAVGILVGDGRLDPADPAPVPEWRGTAREAITLLDLLEMRSGLAFVEDYVDGESSDVIEMLFGAGRDDCAAYAASKPAQHPPGAVWSYSSGTTNIVSRVLGDLVAGAADAAPAEREAAMRSFLDQRLFGPTGMTDARPRFDDAGNWVASSYVDAPARQYARFGELYLRDGVARDGRVLPAGWVDHARTFVAHDPENGHDYGRHWWMWPEYPASLAAHGYEGQYVLVLPREDAVIVHLGKTDAAVRDRLEARLRRVVDAL